MERPLSDARNVVPGAPASSTASQSTFNFCLAFQDREHAKSGLASFPHEEDVELMRSYSAPSNVSNPVKGTTSTSVIAAGSTRVWSNPFPHWAPSPLTPRYLAAIAHQPSPIKLLLPGSATGMECVSVLRAEAVNSEASSQIYNSQSTNDTVREITEKQIQTAAKQKDVDTVTSAGIDTSLPSIALPLLITCSLAVPPSSPAVITNLIPAPTKKRKRIPGAMRMRNFLCMHPGCGKSFTDSAHLRDHTVVHTGEKKLCCPTCHKLFARTSTLQEHIRTHTGEKPYVCGVLNCNKRYSSRAAMRSHRSTHASQIVLSARQMSTMHSLELNVAQAQHVELIPFECQGCGKLFRVRELLMAHLKVHSSHRAASIVHPLTPVSPLSSANYNVEDETSTMQRQVYDVNVFNDNKLLHLHENRFLHDTIRAQQNQIEQLKAEVLRLRGLFGDVAGMRPPVQVPHTVVGVVPALTAPVELLQDGVKPFECCICHNRFANFYQLTFHGKQHPDRSMNEVTGGQTPLPVGPKHCPETQCEYAESTGRSLRNLQTLKRHWQRRHQNERPYACLYCPATRQKTFKTRENLKAHEKDCTKNILVR